MTILVATHNAGKIREIRELLDGLGTQLVGLESFAGLPVVAEDGDTFEANAIKKAVTMARATGLRALADDSGLEVDALDGDPGVHSARYAGEECDTAANNHKLLSELGDGDDRRARFRCVLALADPDGGCRTVSGTCEGRIIRAPRGTGGFGYDPLFVPDGYERTFAEMPAAEKNRISHRARALQRARREWVGLLTGNP